jgi:uncharacterized protein (TIGR02679 family)
VTLHQLDRSPLAVAGSRPVFVCENPAILRAAAERLGPRSASLVCTEGQPSVAAARVLDVVAGGGAVLHVRADFDWPGLRIAGALLARGGTMPWRFGSVDYEAALARPGRSGSVRLPADDHALSPWDPALAATMTAVGEAVHEEEVLDLLLADLDAG